MRISDSILVLPAPGIATSASFEDSPQKSPAAHQLRAARSSYSENASAAQIIDAEYVDANVTEAQKLPRRISAGEPQASYFTMEPPPQRSALTVLTAYRQKPRTVPLPGTYLNTFA